MDASDRCFFDVDDSSIVINEKERGIVEVRFGETPHAQHPTAVINVLTYAVFVLLRRMGLFDLHAAAVVSPEGERGALIVGDSGSGKSSLTVRLAASGWGYVSDDMVALCKDAGGVQAHGLRRIFTLTQTTLDACKLSEVEESHGGFWLADPDKRRLAPETLFPRRFVGSCVPRTIFFPTITGEATSSTKRITQGEAMTLLVRRCPWSGYDRAVAPEYLQILAHLARQTAAYELRAGRDLLDTADRAATLFTAHL